MFNQKAFFPALHYFLFLKNAHENNSINPKLKTILLPYCQKDTYRITSNNSRPLMIPAPLKFQKKNIQYL